MFNTLDCTSILIVHTKLYLHSPSTHHTPDYTSTLPVHTILQTVPPPSQYTPYSRLYLHPPSTGIQFRVCTTIQYWARGHFLWLRIACTATEEVQLVSVHMYAHTVYVCLQSCICVLYTHALSVCGLTLPTVDRYVCNILYVVVTSDELQLCMY